MFNVKSKEMRILGIVGMQRENYPEKIPFSQVPAPLCLPVHNPILRSASHSLSPNNYYKYINRFRLGTYLNIKVYLLAAPFFFITYRTKDYHLLFTLY